MAKQIRDSYANKFYGTVTESAQGTLTFSEIQTNVAIFTKLAWILHRLEWYIPEATQQLLLSPADILQMALTNSDNITALDLSAPAVVDMAELQCVDRGTAGSMHLFEVPIIRDFSNLPGGGIIMAPRPLYAACVSASIASAATVEVRGYFTQKELKADEYIELVDFYRIVE